MRIAVLLRGQARYGKYGAHLFHTMVKDRFPDIEFKIFISTWKSISQTMTENFNENSVIYAKEYNQKYVTEQEIYDNEIKPWGESCYVVNKESDLFHTIVHGLKYLVEDEYLLKWWDTHTSKYKINPQDTVGSEYAFPNYDQSATHKSKFELFVDDRSTSDENILLKNNAIYMQHQFGQTFSSGKSYQLLTQYQTKNPDYQPDLIWSTRLDAVHWFDNVQQLTEIIDNINSLNNNGDIKKDNLVLVDKIFIKKGYNVMLDFNFYMIPDAAKSFFIGKEFDSPEDNLFSLFTKDKHRLISVLGSGGWSSHTLWSIYARDCMFVEINDSIGHETVLLRPSVNLTNIKSLSPTYETFKFLKEQWGNYIYPKVNAQATNSMIRKSFNDLLNN